jgi:DNA uptake protein ComE-like DNA-binding protein
MARKNKDIATLKRVFAKGVLEFLTEMGQTEKKSLDDQLKELTEKPQADSSETRNEKINGNRATLEYLNEKGAWSTMDFSKEGNEWKMDIPKAQ